MTKSVRDFILSLILLGYTLVMIVFFREDFDESFPVVYTFIGLYFVYNSLSIYFPRLNDFPGSRKPFSYYFKESSKETYDANLYRRDRKQALLIILLYFPALTLVGFFIHSLFDQPTIYIFFLFLLINLADYICVLFWCPFRQFFLKNKCCTTCRITNWDRLMKFWILLFIPHPMSYLLFGIGLFVFVHWEYTIYKYPKRFYASTNESLRCYHCDDIQCKK